MQKTVYQGSGGPYIYLGMATGLITIKSFPLNLTQSIL